MAESLSEDASASLPPLFGSAAAREALCREAEDYVARAKTTMNRARLLVLDDRKRCIGLLTARRIALGRHFMRYQRFKHGQIFDPVVQHGRASSKVVARTMKLDCMALGEQFGAYHSRWTRVRASDWPDYREDMLEMVEATLVKLDAELRAMRQLLMISNFYGG